MKHIIGQNLSSANTEMYLKQFKSNTPFPHFIIDNFLNEDSANKVLNNFEINEKWTNGHVQTNDDTVRGTGAME